MVNQEMEDCDSGFQVSAVVPCYNVADLVGEAVGTLVNQSLPPCEIILVNDGSTDDTGSVINEMKSKNPNLLRVIHTDNRGATAARNTGLSLARGNYVQFMDADDLLHLDKLERQYGIIKSSNKQPDLIVAPYIRQKPGAQDKVIGLKYDDPWVSLAHSDLGCTCSNLWRRDFVNQVGGWDEKAKSSQEANLMFRMLRAGAHVEYDRVPSLTARKREGSVSTSNRADFFRRSLSLRLDMRAFCEQQGEDGKARVMEINKAIFKILDELYKQDSRSSIELHRQVIPRSFNPPRQRMYKALYRLFGFGFAQWWQEATKSYRR